MFQTFLNIDSLNNKYEKYIIYHTKMYITTSLHQNKLNTKEPYINLNHYLSK